MSARSDKMVDVGKVELLQAPELKMTPDAIFKDIAHYFGRTLGRRTVRTASPFLYQAVVYATRDRIMERWGKTRKAIERDHNRRVSYLSLEFLMGRLLRNALLNLDIEEQTADALQRIGIDLEDEIDEIEAIISKNIAKRGLIVAPILALIFGLLQGWPGAVAALVGVAIVILNFLLGGYLMSRAARVSMNMYHAAALFGFLIRLGLITVSMLSYPVLFNLAFFAKYWGGGSRPSVTSLTNSSLVISWG